MFIFDKKIMRTVLVVGAGKGIGYESVKNLLNKGVFVVALSQNLSQLEKIAEKNQNLKLFKLDIANENDQQGFINRMLNEKIKFNEILFTVGSLIKKDWLNFTQAEITQLYQTNVFGVYFMIRNIIQNKLYLPKLHVVTIGSMGGVPGTLKFPGMLHYSSSKAALACLTECLAEEMKGENLHFNCLSLGAVETEMKNKAFPDFQAPHNSEEMADFVINFLLNSGPFFNGKQLPVSISTP